MKNTTQHPFKLKKTGVTQLIWLRNFIRLKWVKSGFVYMQYFPLSDCLALKFYCTTYISDLRACGQVQMHIQDSE